MVAARDREGSGLTDQDVAGNVLTMLLAGKTPLPTASRG
jgi:cytochrome P450